MHNISKISGQRGNLLLPQRLFWVVFIALSVVQIIRASAHYSPIYGGDEYAYMISGYYRDFLGFLWGRNPMLQKLTNPLYLLFISTFKNLVPDVSAAMRLLGVLAYCGFVGASGLYVSRQSGWPAAVGSVLALGLLPSSAYSAAVMSDILFYCAVATAVIGEGIECAAAEPYPRFSRCGDRSRRRVLAEAPCDGGHTGYRPNDRSVRPGGVSVALAHFTVCAWAYCHG